MSPCNAGTARLALSALLVLSILIGALQFATQPAKGAGTMWSIETVNCGARLYDQ
ncbi:MAG: hypothetical protein AB1665_03580 [Candidatus Thermoplasmatota archaeon]